MTNSMAKPPGMELTIHGQSVHPTCQHGTQNRACRGKAALCEICDLQGPAKQLSNALVAKDTSALASLQHRIVRDAASALDLSLRLLCYLPEEDIDGRPGGCSGGIGEN